MTEEVITITEVAQIVSINSVESVQTVAIESVEVGTQGPPGPRGLPGGFIDGIPFSYNEVSPFFGMIVAADKMVLEARVVIEAPFNGAGATISIGDVDDHESLMTTTQNDPFTAGSYSVSPLKTYPSNKTLNLYMNPGTDPSQGSGRFFITIEG